MENFIEVLIHKPVEDVSDTLPKLVYLAHSVKLLSPGYFSNVKSKLHL